jgi:chlorite dismutase
MEYNFDQVHNYFERLVFEEVARRAQQPDFTSFTADMLADVACLALNRLPARYVRHDVDMMFYLTEQERQAMEHSLNEVLTFSFAFVLERTARSAR